MNITTLFLFFLPSILSTYITTPPILSSSDEFQVSQYTVINDPVTPQSINDPSKNIAYTFAKPFASAPRIATSIVRY